MFFAKGAHTHMYMPVSRHASWLWASALGCCVKSCAAAQRGGSACCSLTFHQERLGCQMNSGKCGWEKGGNSSLQARCN